MRAGCGLTQRRNAMAALLGFLLAETNLAA
jgi:hypothetical protein